MVTKQPIIESIIQRLTLTAETLPDSENTAPPTVTRQQRNVPMSQHMATLANEIKNPR